MAMELIRYLYEQKELPAAREFYQNALQKIENDGISSQIYTLLQKQERLGETPDFFQKHLKENYTKGLYQNLFIKNQTDRLLEHLAGQGIDVIPLKGVYFAAKFFGHFAARVTSDIDLLIREGDMNKAIGCVKDLGFTVEEERIPGHFHCSFSKKLPGSPIPLVVEIHWDIVKKQTANFNINEFWAKAVPGENCAHIMELSPYHTFYMITLHGWRHNLDSMKYFLDIIEVIHSLNEKMDYETLLDDARRHQTYKRMVRTLTIVYQQFPHLETIKKFPYKRSNVYWEYRSAKNVKKYLDFIDYQFLSYDSPQHCLIEGVHWLFPSRSDLLAQLEGSEKNSHFSKSYFLLLKKRLTSFFKAVFSGS